MAKSGPACSAVSLIQTCAQVLLLICSGLAASPTWADQVQTDKAIASYLNATLPAIETLQPYIGQPEAARANAFANMGLQETVCDAAAVDAIRARENLAEGAANICRALIAWMQADEISTCSQVKYTKSDLARTDQANPAILSRHNEAGVLATRLQLEQAAGCAQKDITYWGGAVIQIYDELSRNVSLTGDLVAATSGKTPLTAKQFDHKLFQCHLARNLDDTRRSAVVEAANDGCYAMYDLAARKTQGACESVEKGLKEIDAMTAGDPLARAAPSVRTLLIDSFSDLTCGPILTAAHAQARAEAARAQLAEEMQRAQTVYNTLANQFSRQIAELNRWSDENKASAGDGDLDEAIYVADEYCQIYNRINQTQFETLDAIKTMIQFQSSSELLNLLAREQALKEQLNTDRNEWCDMYE